MRIASSEVYRQGLAGMTQLSSDTAKIQQQISSGKRILAPGDDPIGASRIIRLEQQQAVTAQYQRNINAAETRLAESEAVLTQMLDIIQRIRELGLQAANGINTPDDRRFIGIEIGARFEELLSIANGRDADGSFLFAGFQGKHAPFVVSGQEVNFQGDSGQRFLQIDTGLDIAISDSGRRLLQDIDAPATRLITHGSSASGQKVEGKLDLAITDQELVNSLSPDNLRIDISADPDSGSPRITVRRSGDGRIMNGLEDLPLIPGMKLQSNGIAIEIQGNPKPGDSYFIDTTPKRNVLTVINEAALGFTNPDLGDETNQGIEALTEDLLVSLDNAMGSILGVQAELGARMNTLDSARQLHDSRALQTERTLSEIRDIDFAEAVSRLDYQSFVLEAAQQSFIRISNLSLFNLL